MVPLREKGTYPEKLLDRRREVPLGSLAKVTDSCGRKGGDLTSWLHWTLLRSNGSCFSQHANGLASIPRPEL